MIPMTVVEIVNLPERGRLVRLVYNQDAPPLPFRSSLCHADGRAWTIRAVEWRAIVDGRGSPRAKHAYRGSPVGLLLPAGAAIAPGDEVHVELGYEPSPGRPVS